jgi:Domain of unknown function (DUF4389)
MTTMSASPVRVDARLDQPLNRWLWLVKWLLVIPHAVVLGLLWVAFTVLTVVAFFAILFTGRYPHPLFEFNLGVLRWTWRVAYYSYGVLGTDRYPPFTLAEVPDYPATLHVAYPEGLSRGLVLIKWWLLAIPHFLVISFFIGSGSYVSYQWWQVDVGGGLVSVLVLIAAVALLFTGRYPGGVFDLVLGLNRWVLRAGAYVALMTDRYPPFRLDQGGVDPASAQLGTVVPADTDLAPPTPGTVAPAPSHWSAGRVVTAVIGSLLLVIGVATAVGGIALLVGDRVGRDADGYLSSGTERFTSSGYALQSSVVDLHTDRPGPDLGTIIGDVRVRATGATGNAIFVGIGPASAVDQYLAQVDRDRIFGIGPQWRDRQQHLSGSAPSTPPATQSFWVASASGPGTQQLTWRVTEGDWAVVVMNADGSRPVNADLSAGATVPALGWVWITLLIVGGICLVLGTLLVLLAVPRRRAEPPGSGPDDPTGPIPDLSSAGETTENR